MKLMRLISSKEADMTQVMVKVYPNVAVSYMTEAPLVSNLLLKVIEQS